MGDVVTCTTNLSMTESHNKEANSAYLIDAIEKENLSRCQELIKGMSPRDLNKNVTFKFDYNVQLNVCPLVWSVMKSNHEVTELLLRKGAQADRPAYLKRDHQTYTYSPILKALENRDLRMVELLLEYGVDPQKGVPSTRDAEEEDGTMQFGWIYPLNEAMALDYEFFVKFMRKSDINKIYGEQCHTCLCYAIQKFLQMKNWDQSVIQFIIQHGGRICSGEGGNDFCPIGICSYFLRLIRISCSVGVSLSKSLQFNVDNSIAGVTVSCNVNTFNALKLVCYSDYAHEDLTIYNALKRFSICNKNVDFLAPNVNSCDRSKNIFHWLVEYSKTPSTLKHICRVAIRQEIKDVCPEKCQLLPLPACLIKYVALLDLT